jgi:hypothetical protein
MRALSAAARTHVRVAAGTRHLGELVEFVETVVLLVAHPLGDPEVPASAPELATADRVIALVERALAGDTQGAEAAGDLAADPEMLAAFFQNLDLLPRGGHRAADAVALLVMLALSRLEEIGGRPEL